MAGRQVSGLAGSGHFSRVWPLGWPHLTRLGQPCWVSAKLADSHPTRQRGGPVSVKMANICWFSAKLADSQPTCRRVGSVSLEMANIDGR